MPVITQGYQTGEYVFSEDGPGKRSRDQGTVTVAGAVALPSGTVLGKITATSKYVKHDVAGTDDGRRTAVAVLYTPLVGVNGDYQATLHTDDCEVIGAALNGGTGVTVAAKASLLLRGIKVR